ncbi:hypothetical protein F6X86_03345 [Enterococcus durans]|uniref:DUF4649 family protein n=1 Tax=Enterococcus durans TaxID=53345 RepID=A0A5N0YRN6_9ENTE|nr:MULTISPECIES: hypothetical protein [Enterococcus]KAA9180218.1 hypothetical protein F6X86_03345 [Enterococcus durans]KAA9187344.1 hypothetical protein F6X85_03935 [Enterococcus durans]KAA9187513.1 hypothetical protein F6X90_03975 [Enterococcus durans]KAA9192326.1 hypothetical protein F6Y12_04580 [Enterococcus durans]KAA9194645.1 hypothetical protein F6X87_05885 [Enterococcus durans]
MLNIYYQVAEDAKPMEKEYGSVNEFLQGQYLEVPSLQDHFKVIKAMIDGEEVTLKDQTIGGLFNLLNM